MIVLLLASCGQNITEHYTTSRQTIPSPPATQPTDSATSTSYYTSGDRPVNGPNDTLHVSHLVIRMMPGSKSDFADALRSQPSFSEARAIKQEGNGRVRRLGHTLLLRPYNGPALRFADDTYQMRKDANEEEDTQYQFLGSVSERPYWLVAKQQWENYQPFLINKNSGRATPLTCEPDISPDKRYLLVATPGLDGESPLNGLQLWAISDQVVTPLWTRALQNWQPQQVRWLDNHTIAIEQLRFEPHEQKTYVRLVLPN